MKARLLFVLLAFTTQVSFSQYCGTSGSNICSANNTFTSPGITDYTTFPCVHNNVPYSEVVQVLFPTSVNQFGMQISVDTIIIDSISNLPCGLCWSCDNSSFLYLGGSKACLRFTGTANDSVGAYQINMYGTAYTALGPYSGSLENLGFQFFLNVVGQNDACTPINITSLNTACQHGNTQPTNNCNVKVEMSATNQITNCNFTGTTLTVVQPSGPGYQSYWIFFPDTITTFPPTYIIDSGQSQYVSAANASQMILNITDTATGCSVNPNISFTNTSGFVHTTSVCYATCDSSNQLTSNAITLVFEKDDWFNNINRYILYRQDSTGQVTPDVIGQIASTAPGKIVDTMPNSILWNVVFNGVPYYTNAYTIGSVTTCGEIFENYNTFYPSILRVDTMSSGLPQLIWNNSTPLTYDGVYIFSRYPGGNWRLRFSSITLTDTTWVDQSPDSTQMQYMLGYNLTVNCDPSRSANMAFSNFGAAYVLPQHVVPDTGTTITPTGVPLLSRVQDVLLYPNPANDQLTLQIAAVQNLNALNYKIYDVLGQVVGTGALSITPRQQLNIEHLSSGIYSLSIQADKQAPVVRMFVKE